MWESGEARGGGTWAGGLWESRNSWIRGPQVSGMQEVGGWAPPYLHSHPKIIAILDFGDQVLDPSDHLQDEAR